MSNNNEKWVLKGDINFTAYGGCLIRKHWDEKTRIESPILANEYDVFYLIPTNETGNGLNLATMYLIDLDDVTIDDINAFLEATGYEEYIGKSREELINELTPETVLSEIVRTLGGGRWNYSTYTTDYPSIINYGEERDFSEMPEYISDNDLYDWMVNLGMEDYLGGLEKTEE